MEPTQAPGIVAGSRRNEDIALDLLKFVVASSDYVKHSSVGFQQASARSEDQAAKLLELYGRCLQAVEGRHK